MSLSFHQMDAGPNLTIKLFGNMDESADYTQINFGTSTSLVFDFSEVKLFNSLGIQKWINFLKAIPSSLLISYTNCPVIIVNQLNILPAIKSGKRVRIVSFYAPYFCESCEISKEVLINSAQPDFAAAELQPPGVECPRCKQAMEFDEIEEVYFNFLRAG